MTNLVSDLLTAALLVALPALLIALYSAWESKKSQLPADKLALVQQIASMAVYAVEAYNAASPGVIESKKDAAIAKADAWLSDYGIDLDFDLLGDAIEQAWLDMKNSGDEIKSADKEKETETETAETE